MDLLGSLTNLPVIAPALSPTVNVGVLAAIAALPLTGIISGLARNYYPPRVPGPRTSVNFGPLAVVVFVCLGGVASSYGDANANMMAVQFWGIAAYKTLNLLCAWTKSHILGSSVAGASIFIRTTLVLADVLNISNGHFSDEVVFLMGIVIVFVGVFITEDWYDLYCWKRYRNPR